MPIDTTEFNETIEQFYSDHGRHDLLWRQPEPDGSFDPYKILVSEVMLQQTQVRRVTPKFHEFLMKFPTVNELADAPLAEVLKAWSGLGYNRRAKFLWRAAQMIAEEFNGNFPHEVEDLMKLPGVGRNTAGAVRVYAFNEPAIFIETNIRTVFIHHFFHDSIDVPDAAIIDLLRATLSGNPREFYWALMDYGSFLKQTVGNANKFSRSYVKQSKFEGSKRQIRGQVLRLLATKSMNLEQLRTKINDPRLASVVEDLVNEMLIKRHGASLSL